jgi:hypothetical protein
MNGLRLTRAQLELWLAHRLYADPSVLGVPFTIDVAAALDADALARAFQTLVNSADALRTTVVEDQGSALGLVGNHVPACVHIESLEDDPALLQHWLDGRIRRTFRLDQCLFDFGVLRISDNRTVLYLNQHHLITDAWSIRLTAR